MGRCHCLHRRLVQLGKLVAKAHAHSLVHFIRNQADHWQHQLHAIWRKRLFQPGQAPVLCAPASPKIGLGLWMFSVVLLWDILIAAAIVNMRALSQFSTVLPWLERVSGGVLIVLALVVLASMLG
jgi:hypothetical protein